MWWVLALSLAYAGMPPAPELGNWSWSVDREALPPLTLRVVHVATTEGTDKDFFDGGSKKEDRVGPVSVVVIEHPTKGLVLIDAGYGKVTAADPSEYPGKKTVKLLGLTMKTPAADRLPDIGKNAEDVQHIVFTHLHNDHAGGTPDFPKAALWADEREVEVGLKRGFLKGYNKKAYEDRSFEPLSFAETESYGPFEGHVDLFDDGSIILLPAPGHTPGSLMVLVNLKSGSLLFTGDAAWCHENWQGPTRKGPLPRTFVEDDWKTGMDALWRVKSWQVRYPDLEVVPGHEIENVKSLPRWPDARD